MEIIGYDNQDDLDRAVAQWDAGNPGNPMIDQHKAQQREADIIRSTLENLAFHIRTEGGISVLLFNPDEAIEVCADSVVMETGCRQIDAIVTATFLIEAISALDINWPTT